MAQFPKSESQIIALAHSMIAGFASHPADFPSIDPQTKLTALQEALNNYTAKKNAQQQAQSQAQIATVVKEDVLEELIETMKNDLKLSEVDCTASPEKLFEIGWGPRQQLSAVEKPGQCIDLHMVAEGPGLIVLNWQRPMSGGNIRNYIISRRQQPAGGQFGDWQIAATSLDTSCRLTGQPRGVQLEYRVNAVNISGQGNSSNSLAVVL